MARQKEKPQAHPDHPRLYLVLRSDSRWFQARAYIKGQNRQFSTRTQHLPTARRLAEDWYLRETRVGAKKSDPLDTPIMEELFDAWKLELTGSKREWVQMKWGPIARFWEAKRVSEISTQTFKEFYRWRRQATIAPKNPTLHQDVVLIRQILKYAVEEQHIKTIPAIPSVGKIEPNPRPWLTHQEWRILQKESGRRIAEAVDNPKLSQQRQELDDQMVWMVATMMRVEEMAPCKKRTTPVRFRDCRIVKNSEGKDVLICEVKGKRGPRTVVCRKKALDIFEHRYEKGRNDDDYIFPHHHRDGLRELLTAAKLYVDPRSGLKRNFKSFRCTAISFAVLEGIELMWIARNAGTSLTMIDQFYARRLSAEMAKDELTKPWKDED